MNRANRNIKVLNAMMLMHGLCFFLPILLPYFHDEIGIGFFEMMITEAAFCLTIVLMEIPSGWLSDIFRRKDSALFGSFFLVLATFILLIADSAFDATLSQILFGIGVSFHSGTLNAILYDSLLEQGREKEYRKREGFRTSLNFYALASSSFTAGFLYELDHHLPILLSLWAYIITFIFTFFLQEPTREKENAQKNPFKDMLDTMHYALHGHKVVAGIIGLSCLAFSATKLMMFAQQPYYVALNLPEKWFGILGAAGFFAAALGSHFSHLISDKISHRIVLAGALLTIILVCLTTSCFISIWSVPVLLLAGNALYGTVWPHVQDAINSRVTSARRATILSTASLMINLVFIPISAVFGWISDEIHISWALFALATFETGIGSILIALMFTNGKKKVRALS